MFSGVSDLEGGLEPFVVAGGPRASILAKPGLKRAAILLVSVGFIVVSGVEELSGVLVCFFG